MNRSTSLSLSAVSLIFLIALSFSPARAGWSWVYPLPQGHDLNDIAFLSTSTAVAVGDAGAVLVSHDAGVTWTAVTAVNGTTTPLNKVARIDDMTAVAVGDGGVVLKTTDGGATWQTKTSGTVQDLVDVDFAGQTGMAVSSGFVLKSVNGGDSWATLPWSVSMAGNGPYGGIDVVDALVAHLTQDFVFHSTADGGVTWAYQFLPNFQTGLGEVSFSDANHGVVSANHSTDNLFVTTDGGGTWSTRTVEPAQSETGISISDVELTGSEEIVVSTGATICDINGFRCSSYGEAQASTISSPSWDWDREWTPRALTGVAVSDAGVRLFSGTGGVIHRWAPPATIEQVAGNATEALPAGGALAFAGDGHGIAVQYEDSYFWADYEFTITLLTSDGGASWTSPGSYAFAMRDVMFTPGAGSQPAYGVGLVTGTSNGFVRKSADGGHTWTTLPGGTFPSQNALAFASPARAVSVGEGGSVVVIDNDVVTPSTQSPAASLRDVAFVSPLDGLAVGGTAVIMRTEDGGDTWASIGNSASAPLYGVGYATTDMAVAVGAQGTVLRSANGGASWTPVPAPTTADLRAVRFLTDTHGFICGANGRVLETSDGGQSWMILDSPTSLLLTDIEPFGSGVCFSGPGINILAYDQQPVPTLVSRFDASAADFGVNLAWEVVDASALDHFRIERRESTGRRVSYDITAERRTYRDGNVLPGTRYEYQLFALDRDGGEVASPPVSVVLPSAAAQLLPNVPNPFNPSTTLRFVVPSRDHVTLSIYDVAGRLVATLVDGVRTPGMNEVEWNGRDANGNPVASGVYLSRLRVGTANVSRTMVLLK